MTRLLALAVALVGTYATAADLPPVLAKMPKEAGFVLVVEKPRAVVENVYKLDVYQNLRQFPQVREYLDSTAVRRFYQFVAHLEKKSGAAWPELLEKIAGGGLAIGLALGADPAPTYLIAQGTDAKSSETAFDALLEAIADAAAADGTGAIRKVKVGSIETVHVGDDFHIARDGATIYVGSTEVALKTALTKPTGSVTAVKSLTAARKLVGPDPAAWAWLDVARGKEVSQATRDFLESSRKDFLGTIVIGGTLDAVRRADLLVASLHQSEGGFKLSVKLPRAGGKPDPSLAIHSPGEGKIGSKPLLMPTGVIASQSFYLDIAHLWANRKELMNDEIRANLEKADTDISKVLPGTSFGKILESLRPHHRLVMAHTGEKLYAREPGQPIPPSAVVLGFKDAKSASALDGVLRGGAFLAGFQTGWTMREETIDGVKVVTYRFPEKGEPKFPDADGLRFAAAPTFAIVGDSLIVGSTPGIVKLLIPELKTESKSDGHHAAWRATAFTAGAAATLRAQPDSTITDTVLQQGVGLAEAKKQVAALTDWLATLGKYEMSIDHATAATEYVIEWKIRK